MLPLDLQASYEQTLRLARDTVRETLLTSREASVGRVGCLAVASRLAELPTAIKDTRRVDAAFFGIE